MSVFIFLRTPHTYIYHKVGYRNKVLKALESITWVMNKETLEKTYKQLIAQSLITADTFGKRSRIMHFVLQLDVS